MSFGNLDQIKEFNSSFEEKKFLDQDVHQKALKDFKFLCVKTAYNTFNNLNFITVRTLGAENKYLGEYLVLGYQTSEKKVMFPAGFIDTENPNHNVAVVCYADDGSVIDVLLFKAAEFKKTGMFSMFKNMKNEGAYAIALGNADGKNLKQYSFGYVLKKM